MIHMPCTSAIYSRPHPKHRKGGLDTRLLRFSQAQCITGPAMAAYNMYKTIQCGQYNLQNPISSVDTGSHTCGRLGRDVIKLLVTRKSNRNRGGGKEEGGGSRELKPPPREGGLAPPQIDTVPKLMVFLPLFLQKDRNTLIERSVSNILYRNRSTLSFLHAYG